MPELATVQPRIGTVLTLAGATLAELLAEPFDLIWVDLEHGALGRLDAQEMILGAQAAGTAALVRLPADADHVMTAMMDAGADGIVLADVRDAATAEGAIERMLHPPDGTRGWGPRRLTLRRRRHSQGVPDSSVSVQIESAEGVENAAAIAAVPGIDAIVVGTADLSFSLGSPHDVGSPGMVEAIDTVREAARAGGVEFGVAGPIDRLPPGALAGAGQIIHGTDARICASAVDRAVEQLRIVTSREDDGS